VGIDVSRDFFDYTLKKGKDTVCHSRTGNNVKDIASFIESIAVITGCKHTSCVFGMEHTGIYCNHLLETLHKAGANIVHENALSIRNSLGLIRGKTDQLDSERIASYLYKSRAELALWKPRRDVIGYLAVLASIREKLEINSKGIKQTLKEYSAFTDEQVVNLRSTYTELTLSSIKQDISDINDKIKELWTSDTRLKELMEYMISVPSIGEKTALQILIKTNEFKDISDPRKFACLAGIAPFPYQSGKSLNGAAASPILRTTK
jgi:transposase